MNNRIEKALRHTYSKFRKAQDAIDILRAISDLENEDLRDIERYFLYNFFQGELPGCFKLAYRQCLRKWGRDE